MSYADIDAQKPQWPDMIAIGKANAEALNMMPVEMLFPEKRLDGTTVQVRLIVGIHGLIGEPQITEI